MHVEKELKKYLNSKMHPFYSKIPLVKSFLYRIKRYLNIRGQSKNVINYLNKGIINFIDVGSIGGLPEPWESNLIYIKNILMFEPQEKDFVAKNIIKKATGLWNESGSYPFHLYKGFNSSGSSLFEQNITYVEENFEELRMMGDKFLADSWFERSKLIETKAVWCSTLDQVLSNIEINYDFLKIDAQGAEYEILQGGKNFLHRDCIGLHLELFNIPLYKNIKLKDEVIKFLARKGFELVKTYPPHGTFHSQNDCVFLKKDLTIDQNKKKKVIKKIYNL